MALTEKPRPTKKESPELCPESRWKHAAERHGHSVSSAFTWRGQSENLITTSVLSQQGERSFPDLRDWAGGLTTSRLGRQGLALGHEDYLALNIGYVMQIMPDESVALVHKNLNNAFVFI